VTLFDYIVLIWFMACWAGFTYYADYGSRHEKSVSFLIEKYRHVWMHNMLSRELRMVDTMVHSNLLQGVAFFASTSLLLVGGLVTVLGATDQGVAMLGHLPFAVPTSRAAWEVKVLLLIVVFIYSFFKFAWSFRLFNYCSILLGAAPLETEPSEQGKKIAGQLVDLQNLAGRHFNRGVRAYFFAIAGLAWFVHPAAFAVATTWVTYVLHRREFRSLSHRILSGGS